MTRPTAPVAPPADALAALSRALHGVLTPFVAHGSTLVPSTIEARATDGALHPITPSGDVWQQLTANEVLRGIAPTEILFDLAATPILEEAQRALFAHDKGHLRAELVAADVQEPGARVEPKLPPCDATLVVCLPSRFFGGELVAAHRGAIELFRWGSEIESDPDPRRVRWAAVRSSARAQVERVRQGSRVALVYALYRTAPSKDRIVDEKAHTDAIRHALRALRGSLDAGAVLAVPSAGGYASVDRFVQGPSALAPEDDALLIGRDAHLSAAAHAQGLRVRLQPYLLDVRAGETFRLERFVEARRAPLAEDDRKRALAALTAKLPALSSDSPTEESFVIDAPRFTGIPKRYELDARTPKALFEELPAIEPAPIAGVVRADCAAAAFYVYSALLVDGVGAVEKPKPAKVEPEKPAKSGGATKKAAPKAAAKTATKSASKPEPKRATAKKKVTASGALGDFRKGIADVLARIESKSKGKRR